MILEFVGKVCLGLDVFKQRVVNRYKLSKLAAHGRNCHIEGSVNISYNNIYIGDNVFIPSGATFISSNANIYIGSNVMFGPNVMIATGNHRIDVIGKYMIDVKEKRAKDDEDVVIEDDVWIGMNVMILKGVHVGRGSVIGAGAIVTKNVPPYSVITNIVNTNIRSRFTNEQIVEHETRLEYENKTQQAYLI